MKAFVEVAVATGFKPYLVHCCWKGVLYLLRHNYLGTNHRHLTEIDCSSAVVGGLAADSESGGKSIHWTRMWRQKVLHSTCCGWQHNYYSQQRQVGRANEQSTSLRCLWYKPITKWSYSK